MKTKLGLILTISAGSLLASSFTGCSTAPQIKKIDTDIDAKGSTTSGGVVGVKNGEAIIQQTTEADSELRWQEWKNMDLESKVDGEHHWVKRCRVEIADPRLGGNGNVAEIPEVDGMKMPETIKEEMGLTENGQLRIVKKQDFTEKLRIERKYELELTTALKLLKKAREKCEIELGHVRVSHGLPAERYVGRFAYDDQGRVSQVLRENENSLDDAFRISRAGRAERTPAGEKKGEEEDAAGE